MGDQANIEAVKRKLRFDYLKVRNELPSKNLELFTSLLGHFNRPQLVISELMQDAANQIHKQFRFRWTMIGLKSHSDGLYRYFYHSGMREDAWTKQKTKVYKYEDFNPNSPGYKAGEISRLTRVYLEEENPLYKDDEGVVNRPALLRARRKTEEDTLEADFVDTLILGHNDELLGWIEYSGTIAGKFPDAMTIRHIEVVSGILGAALMTRTV